MTRHPTLVKKGKWIINWFTNMTPVKIEIDGVMYNSVENYYQSQKILNPILRKEIANLPPCDN